MQQDTWYTHPVLMRFLLENLLSNAVKYNRQGGSIRLTAEIKENQLHLEVADTGIGISPEHLPHIFTCFYRADPSRNKEIAGNGLGLSIVKTAVEKMQGEITVESEEVKGTCFHVTLPVLKILPVICGKQFFQKHSDIDTMHCLLHFRHSTNSAGRPV